MGLLQRSHFVSFHNLRFLSFFSVLALTLTVSPHLFLELSSRFLFLIPLLCFFPSQLEQKTAKRKSCLSVSLAMTMTITHGVCGLESLCTMSFPFTSLWVQEWDKWWCGNWTKKGWKRWLSWKKIIYYFFLFSIEYLLLKKPFDCFCNLCLSEEHGVLPYCRQTIRNTLLPVNSGIGSSKQTTDSFVSVKALNCVLLHTGLQNNDTYKNFLSLYAWLIRLSLFDWPTPEDAGMNSFINIHRAVSTTSWSTDSRLAKRPCGTIQRVGCDSRFDGSSWGIRSGRSSWDRQCIRGHRFVHTR